MKYRDQSPAGFTAIDLQLGALLRRLAGSAEEGWITYVQKTETLQAPDYVSVRFYDLDGDNLGKATIAVYSRSRFGHGDMGVNEARVKAWLTSISSFEE